MGFLYLLFLLQCCCYFSMFSFFSFVVAVVTWCLFGFGILFSNLDQSFLCGIFFFFWWIWYMGFLHLVSCSFSWMRNSIVLACTAFNCLPTIYTGFSVYVLLTTRWIVWVHFWFYCSKWSFPSTFFYWKTGFLLDYRWVFSPFQMVFSHFVAFLYTFCFFI